MTNNEQDTDTTTQAGRPGGWAYELVAERVDGNGDGDNEPTREQVVFYADQLVGYVEEGLDEGFASDGDDELAQALNLVLAAGSEDDVDAP